MDPKREFNFLILYTNNDNLNQYDYVFENLLKSNPNIHSYYINTNKLEEEYEKIKEINFEMAAVPGYNAKPLSFILQKFPQIKWIHAMSAGVETFFNLDEFNAKKDLVFSNSKGAFSESFGEIGILQMMYFNYNIPKFYEAQKQKEFLRPMNETLAGKNLLIYGYGHNGIELAKRAKVFKMKIYGVLRTLKDNIPGKEFCDEIITYEKITDDIIHNADFVFATLPETKDTINFFNLNFFKKMKKTAVFMNIGRGSAVVEDDIVEALNNNIIRGACLDVFQKEPLDKSSKLYTVPQEKLFLTNHDLGVVSDYLVKCFKCIEENIISYLEKGKPVTVVDKEFRY